MADFKSDVLGEATGNAGASCFYRWRGKAYVRARMIARGNGNATREQLIQQAKFTYVNKHIAGMGSEWLKFGFPSPEDGQTSRSWATKVNFAYYEGRGVFEESHYPKYPDVTNPAVMASANQFTWRDNVIASINGTNLNIKWTLDPNREPEDFSVIVAMFGQREDDSSKYGSFVRDLDYDANDTTIDITDLGLLHQGTLYYWLYNIKTRKASNPRFTDV